MWAWNISNVSFEKKHVFYEIFHRLKKHAKVSNTLICTINTFFCTNRYNVVFFSIYLASRTAVASGSFAGHAETCRHLQQHPACERSFSAYGNIHTAKRNRLTNETAGSWCMCITIWDTSRTSVLLHVMIRCWSHILLLQEVKLMQEQIREVVSVRMY